MLGASYFLDGTNKDLLLFRCTLPLSLWSTDEIINQHNPINQFPDCQGKYQSPHRIAVITMIDDCRIRWQNAVITILYIIYYTFTNSHSLMSNSNNFMSGLQLNGTELPLGKMSPTMLDTILQDALSCKWLGIYFSLSNVIFVQWSAKLCSVSLASFLIINIIGSTLIKTSTRHLWSMLNWRRSDGLCYFGCLFVS